MSRTINIVAPDNGVGLTADAIIIEQLLMANGYAVTKNSHSLCDLNIFLEVVRPEFFSKAKKNILLPNPEWFFSEWKKYIRKFNLIVCKTRHTKQVFDEMGARTHYTGFTSIDKYLPEVEKEKTFVHIAGKSSNKGTLNLISLYQLGHDTLPPLTIYSHSDNQRLNYILEDAKRIKKLTIIKERVSDEELKVIQNKNLFHVCTSSYEGFGHYINEAKSTGAIIITTNAAPMNELVTPQFGFGVKSEEGARQCLVKLNNPTINSMYEAITTAEALPQDMIDYCSYNARKSYLEEREQFEKRFLTMIKDITA